MNFKYYLFYIFAFLFIPLASWAGNDVTIARIDDTPISVSEFEYAYNKQGATNQKKDTPADFLADYINLKLKVLEAKANRLDKDKAFEDEYKKYVDELVKPYLEDSVANIDFIETIYNRLQTNIEVQDLFIPFPSQKIYYPNDTVDTYNLAQKIRQEMADDGSNFDVITQKYTEGDKPLAAVGKRRWITSLMTQKNYEDVIFELDANKVSAPIRFNSGYAIVHISNKRKDEGHIRISDLFLAYPENATDMQKDSVLSLANELVQSLKQGADFNTVYTEYGERSRLDIMGDNGYFNIRRPMNDLFKNAIRNIPIGGYAEPIGLNDGIDIVKVTDRIDSISWDRQNPQIRKTIKNKPLAYNFQVNENNALKKEIPYTIDNETYNKILEIASKENPCEASFDKLLDPLKNDILVVVNQQPYTVEDFGLFLKKNRQQLCSSFNLTSDVLHYAVNNYIHDILLTEKKANLLVNNEHLKLVTQEYFDGLLFFNIMSDKIWYKAQTDNVGLTKLYEQQKSKYKWKEPRYEGLLLFAKDEKIKKEAEQLISKNKDNKNLISILKDSLNKNNETNIRIETGMWAKGENEYIDEAIFNIPTTKSFIGYPYFFFEGKKVKQPRDINDVRGLVVTDYQEILDKDWIENLRTKYTISINEEVLDDFTKKYKTENE